MTKRKENAHSHNRGKIRMGSRMDADGEEGLACLLAASE